MASSKRSSKQSKAEKKEDEKSKASSAPHGPREKTPASGKKGKKGQKASAAGGGHSSSRVQGQGDFESKQHLPPNVSVGVGDKIKVFYQRDEIYGAKVIKIQEPDLSKEALAAAGDEQVSNLHK